MIGMADPQGNGDEGASYLKRMKSEKRRKYFTRLCILVIVALLIAIVVLIVFLRRSYQQIESSKRATAELNSKSLKGSNLGSDLHTTLAQSFRADVYHCESGGLKKTFPNLGYAFYGYNIIFGYPMATGHDPGFTHPIFNYDYSDGEQTADCMYNIPAGLFLNSDVSCMTSFSSKTVTDTSQFTKSLGLSAEASASGWGITFSASAEYKTKSSEMQSGESAYIFSSASCGYYYAKLDEIRPPPLLRSFLIMASNLTTNESVFDFFDYFGTHFPVYTLFGAKYTLEHKMDKTTYQKESSDSVSVSVKASYAAIFSIGGSLSKEKQDMAKKFQEQVQTTSVSVGAPPPADGDAMKWASTVKESPLPVRYKLMSIENLFTEKYMGQTGLDYQRLRELIVQAKPHYCKKLLTEGVVNSCEVKQSYKTFSDVSLDNSFYKIMDDYSQDLCISSCIEETRCAVLEFDTDTRKCYLFEATASMIASHARPKAKTVLLIGNMKLLDRNLKIQHATIRAEHRDGSGHTNSIDDCAKLCSKDQMCIAFTFKSSTDSLVKNCHLYQESSIIDDSLAYDVDTTVVIQSHYNTTLLY